jgi:DNA-binding response OmpR family regulator
MNSKRTILAIDDSETTLVLLEWFLKEQGFNALTADSIKGALKIIESNQIDLILLDLQLPVISGYDFLKILKNDSNIKNIPVLVISALDSDDSIREVKALGAIKFIAKPFKLESLLKQINEVLGIEKNVHL